MSGNSCGNTSLTVCLLPRIHDRSQPRWLFDETRAMSSCASCGRLLFDRFPCGGGGGDEKSSLMCECCHRLGQCSRSASCTHCYVSCIGRPRASMDTRTDTRSAPYTTHNSTLTSASTSTLLSSDRSSSHPETTITAAAAAATTTTRTTMIMGEITNSIVSPDSAYFPITRTTSCGCQANRGSLRTRSRPSLTLHLISWIALIALVSTTDACSTRSTPKARSSYISQLQAQQQAQRPSPRLVPHAPQQASSYRAQSAVPVPQTPFAVVPSQSVPTVSDTDLTTQRPNVTFQTYTCPEAYAKWYCLNGASCFSLKIGESILYNCECASGYIGQRCEFKDLDGTYLPRRGVLIETATVSIAAGIVSIMLVATLCCVILYLVIVQRCFQVKKGQYIYENWNPVLTAKQAVPVAVLSADGLVRAV